MKSERKEIYQIPIDNYRFRKYVNLLAGLLKNWSYKRAIRRRANFRKFKKDRVYHQEIKKYYQQFGFKRIDYYWHDFSRHISGIDSVKYIPENIFYKYIEPKFNHSEFADSYSDKNTYHRFKDIIRVPQSIVYNMNGVFYNREDCEIKEEEAIDLLNNIKQDYIIKPTVDTGGGKNISVVGKKDEGLYLDDKKTTAEEVFEKYYRNFSIQEIYKQSEILKRVNPSSMNAIRVFTVRVGDEIIDMMSLILFGVDGTVVNNVQLGGVSCGVNQDGTLKSIAHGKGYKTLTAHPNSKVKFSDVKLIGYKELIEKAKLMHRKLPYFRFASWDLGLDENNEACLIEVNLKHQEVAGLQFKHGPLFKEFTDQILEETFGRKNKKI